MERPELGREHKSKPVSCSVSRFAGSSGVEELHFALTPRHGGSFQEQLGSLTRAYLEALDERGVDPRSCVLRRFFCSDLPNQAALLWKHTFPGEAWADDPCAESWVGQPPAVPAKIALWAYHIVDPVMGLEKGWDHGSLVVDRGELRHRWTTRMAAPETSRPYDQTYQIFEHYVRSLSLAGLRLADQVLRTWFFVKNVDQNYAGFVKARNDVFQQCGLTADTHFIASTGIEGADADTRTCVLCDAYAVAGIRPEQIEQISALDHLSPTNLYGVAFERATAVRYGDRRQILVSGTASIDAGGDIVHPGNVMGQLDRTLENMAALLANAGAGLRDMQYFVVYVRDSSDAVAVGAEMGERFRGVPTILVTAPVCRPGWLVEVEGMAVVQEENPGLPPF